MMRLMPLRSLVATVLGLGVATSVTSAADPESDPVIAMATQFTESPWVAESRYQGATYFELVGTTDHPPAAILSEFSNLTTDLGGHIILIQQPGWPNSVGLAAASTNGLRKTLILIPISRNGPWGIHLQSEQKPAKQHRHHPLAQFPEITRLIPKNAFEKTYINTQSERTHLLYADDRPHTQIITNFHDRLIHSGWKFHPTPTQPNRFKKTGAALNIDINPGSKITQTGVSITITQPL